MFPSGKKLSSGENWDIMCSTLCHCIATWFLGVLTMNIWCLRICETQDSGNSRSACVTFSWVWDSLKAPLPIQWGWGTLLRPHGKICCLPIQMFAVGKHSPGNWLNQGSGCKIHAGVVDKKLEWTPANSEHLCQQWAPIASHLGCSSLVLHQGKESIIKLQNCERKWGGASGHCL